MRQTESGGSWISNASISQQSFSNPTTLIPIELTGKYGEFEKVTDGRFLTAAIGFGGAYTLVFNESYFLSAHFIVNIGANYSSYIKSGAEENETSISTLTHTKIGLGYNGEKFICGLSLNIDSTNHRVERWIIFLVQQRERSLSELALIFSYHCPAQEYIKAPDLILEMSGLRTPGSTAGQPWLRPIILLCRSVT